MLLTWNNTGAGPVSVAWFGVIYFESSASKKWNKSGLAMTPPLQKQMPQMCGTLSQIKTNHTFSIKAYQKSKS